MRRIHVNRKLFSLVCAGLIAACSACDYDPFYHSYLTSIPPKQSICGTWVVDAERTTWPAGRECVRNGSLGADQAFLVIDPDNRFVFQNLPLFGDWSTECVAPGRRCSGDWRTSIQISPSEFAHLWLDIQDVNGTPAEESACYFFRQEGSDYFLHMIIVDPASGDALVLRKSRE